MKSGSNHPTGKAHQSCRQPASSEHEHPKQEEAARREAARQGRDHDDFAPNEARAGDPGREGNGRT